MTDRRQYLDSLSREEKLRLTRDLLASRQQRQSSTGSVLSGPARAVGDDDPTPDRPIDFSLFYFSSDEATYRHDKHRLVLEGARFADEHGFAAVWIPERHFHGVGGLFPNPSVLGAALAMITRRIRIRAGSVVLPLHDPLRVAEEWSVVDNLSAGRVDLAFVPGWNPNDFVLAPDRFGRRRDVTFETVETVAHLWQGGTVTRTDGHGEQVETRIYPAPAQPEPPVWIATSASTESFVRAGELGANVLTALLIQSVEELGERIARYREARSRAGYDRATGRVTVMLHAFLGESMEAVRRTVEAPFRGYMEHVADLWKRPVEAAMARLSPREREQAMDVIFERYFQQAALFGTPELCMQTVHRLQRIGVDELACLIDFGIDFDLTMRGLTYLAELKDRTAGQDRPGMSSARLSPAGST